MTVAPVTFPDAKKVTVDYLRSALTVRPEIYAQNVKVGTKLANPMVLPAVVVRLSGGFRQNLIVNRARLDVRVWHTSEEHAAGLAELVRSFLNVMPGVRSGVTVYDGNEFVGLLDLQDPDHPEVPHVMFTVEVAMRGTPFI